MAFFWVVYHQDYDASGELATPYKNVVVTARKNTSGTFADLILQAPWNDPQNNEQAGEITEARYSLLQDTAALFYDNFPTLPRIQYSSIPVALNDRLGSYADPTDDQSVFTKNVEIADPRPEITFRFPDQTGHTQGVDWAAPGGADPIVGDVLLFRDEKTTGETDPRVKIRIEGPAGWNSTKRFDFGSVPMAVPFTGGVGTFLVDTLTAGRVELHPAPNFKLASILLVTVETDILPVEV